jgi:hypothetical protein
MVETNEQIVREAPEIEAYKLGLLQSAKALSDRGIALPPQLVAQMSGLQTSAINLAQRGIGNYLPYLQEAGYTLGDAQTAIGGVMSGQRGNGNSLPLAICKKRITPLATRRPPLYIRKILELAGRCRGRFRFRRKLRRQCEVASQTFRGSCKRPSKAFNLRWRRVRFRHNKLKQL